MSRNFTGGGFIRSGGSVSFQERGAQPSDFTRVRGFDYAEKWALYGNNFIQKYPFWQIFADCYVMRRYVLQVSGKQRCESKSFRAGDLEGYLEVGFQGVKNFRMPGSDRSSIPNGKYQLESFRFTEAGDSFCDCVVNYVQYGEWEMVQIVSPVPDPVTGIAKGDDQ